MMKALSRSFTGQKRVIIRINITGNHFSRIRIGAGNHQCWHFEHIGRQPRRCQRFDELRSGHQHFAAQVAAFLFRSQLILKMHAGRSGLNHRFHQLKRIK